MIIGGEGGTGALQNAVIITGAPFAFVCFLAMLSLITDFSSSYGRVLLQDETVLIGSSAKLNPSRSHPGQGSRRIGRRLKRTGGSPFEPSATRHLSGRSASAVMLSVFRTVDARPSLATTASPTDNKF